MLHFKSIVVGHYIKAKLQIMSKYLCTWLYILYCAYTRNDVKKEWQCGNMPAAMAVAGTKTCNLQPSSLVENIWICHWDKLKEKQHCKKPCDWAWKPGLEKTGVGCVRERIWFPENTSEHYIINSCYSVPFILRQCFCWMSRQCFFGCAEQRMLQLTLSIFTLPCLYYCCNVCGLI